MLFRKAIHLGKALGPAHLRFGGNDADRMRFNWTGHEPPTVRCDPYSHPPETSNFSLSEPNSFKHKFGYLMTGRKLARDYKVLSRRLKKSAFYHSAQLIGPSITRPNKKSTVKFLKDFLKYGGYKYVNAVTFHQYYVNGRNTSVEDFTDPTVLDSLIPEIKVVLELCNRKEYRYRPVWLGETASAYGGGAPGLSDTYVGGFMWLDKLGLSASLGLAVVVRQSFFRGSYALINRRSKPNPDYWLTLLYKRIVGPRVLKVAVNESTDRKLRFYAHCDQENVTLYGMNLGDHPVTLKIQIANYSGDVYQYLFEPMCKNELTSRKVTLNGRPLLLRGTRFPSMKPQKIKGSTVVLPAKRYVFYQMAAAEAIRLNMEEIGLRFDDPDGTI